MADLPIDPRAALAVARAATQQAWHVDRSGECGDLAIGDVGELEVCAAQTPMFEERADAAADAAHIATFDPPTMVLVLELLLEQDAALAHQHALIRYLVSVARLGPLEEHELVARCPDEEGRRALADLLTETLPLLRRSG